MTARIYRIALLLCGEPIKDVQDKYGDYAEIYPTWLRKSFAQLPEAQSGSLALSVDSYNVFDRQELPSVHTLVQGVDGYDAIIITGAKYSAHDDSEPFIPLLLDWLRIVCTAPAFQHLKIYGVCFGHQLIARLFGGITGPGNMGWEMGVYGLQISEEGKRWHVPEKGSDKVCSHRDAVSVPPPGFILTLSSPLYPIHGLVKEHPSSTLHHPIGHIMTLQGHPEFVPEVVALNMQVRVEAGVITREAYNEGMRRVGGKDGTGGQGLGGVGKDVWRFLLSG